MALGGFDLEGWDGGDVRFQVSCLKVVVRFFQ